MRIRSRCLLIVVAALAVLLQLGQFLRVQNTVSRDKLTSKTINRNAAVVTTHTSKQDEYQPSTRSPQLPHATSIVFRKQHDDESTFSACLLVSDDNHFLIEWLAYHYHMLPLRYLVITVDPRARTRPDTILDRWDGYMTIVRWTDQNFLPRQWLNRHIDDGDSTGLLMKHRERQRNFYPACFEYLKAANRTWTIVTDIDEYVHINPNYDAPAGETVSHRVETSTKPSRTTTVMDIVQETSHYRNVSCITVPRLRFGMREDEGSTGGPLRSTLSSLGMRNRDFMTLRWRWHGPLGSRKVNRLPKSMIDLSKIDSPFDRQDTDAHRPVRSACPRRNLYTQNSQSPLVVHHYVGSKEQFQFRRDARDGMEQRSEEKLAEYSRIQAGRDESIIGWLQGFIEQVGYEEARRLLHGVGNVSFSPIVVGR